MVIYDLTIYDLLTIELFSYLQRGSKFFILHSSFPADDDDELAPGLSLREVRQDLL